MKHTPVIGDIVKFIGTDGKAAFTRVTALELDERCRVVLVLEVQSGRKKGQVGAVSWRDIRWNGKFFVADMRKEGR